MSVNYYAFATPDDDGLHIGQSAAAQDFLLRSHPDRGLTTLAAWMDFLRQPGVVIRAEHGVQLTADEMEATIRERKDPRIFPRRQRVVPGREEPGYHVDPEGYPFCAHEFF